MSYYSKLPIAVLLQHRAQSMLLKNLDIRTNVRDPVLELQPISADVMDRRTQQTGNSNSISEDRQSLVGADSNVSSSVNFNIKETRHLDLSEISSRTDSEAVASSSTAIDSRGFQSVGVTVHDGVFARKNMTSFEKFMITVETGNQAEVKKHLDSLSSRQIRRSINKEDEHGKTALFVACEHGHDDVVSLLLGFAFIKVNKQEDSQNQSTPLYVACEAGHAGVTQLLLNHSDIKVDEMINPVKLLGTSVGLQKEEQDELRRRYGYSEYYQRSTAFYVALERGHSQLVKQFLERGIYFSNSGEQLYGTELYDASLELKIAAFRGDVQIVDQILNTGRADVNSTDNFMTG